jgi:hypothetical protein
MRLAEYGPTQWRWYRRLVGGKWSLWTTMIVGDVWVRGWRAPGCTYPWPLNPVAIEDWDSPEKGS